jgi:hypothetical protein
VPSQLTRVCAELNTIVASLPNRGRRRQPVSVLSGPLTDGGGSRSYLKPGLYLGETYD